MKVVTVKPSIVLVASTIAVVLLLLLFHLWPTSLLCSDTGDCGGTTAPKAQPTQASAPQVLPAYPPGLAFYMRGVRNFQPEEALLSWGHVPNMVHYVWCGKLMLFSFSHFLSMISVQKVQQPTKVTIHYWDFPAKDRNDYNLWFDQMVNTYPNIVLKEINPKDHPMPSNCFDDNQLIPVAASLIGPTGGIYMNPLTALIQPLHRLRHHNLYVGSCLPEKSAGIGFALLSPGMSADSILKRSGTNADSRCVTHSNLRRTGMSNGTLCMTFVDLNLVPKDIMTPSDPLSQLVRLIYYGTPAPMVPRYSLTDPIPNIGHMVLLGGVKVEFVTYIALLSLIYVAGVDAFVHADKEPHGFYWEKLKKERRLHLIYHEFPEQVFNKPLSDLSHSSDLMRYQILERFGGIYVDWDAVMLRPLGNLRGYDFVTAFDWPDWHPPYPDVINSGVSAGKKNAPFMRKCLDLFKKYNPKGDWYYNGLMMPYKVYEQYPELVKIEPRMQVICFNLKCHPTWLPGYHDENKHHLSGNVFDWKTDAYAIHWTRPSPPELQSEEHAKASHTMFADIAKFVLKMASKKRR